MRQRELWTCLVAALIASTSCSGSSTTPTAIALTVKSDLRTPSEIDRLTIHIAGIGNAKSASLDLRQHMLPGTITLVDDGATLGPITVTAVGWLDANQVIEHSVSVSFVPHKTLRVVIELDRVCLGISCDDGETCEQGQCHPIESPRDAGVSTGMAGTNGGTSGMGVAGANNASGGRGGASGVGGMSGAGGTHGGTGGMSGGTGGVRGTSGAGGTGGPPDAGVDSGPPVNQPPHCTITRPTASQALTTGGVLSTSLQGTCTDPETGALAASALQWTSDLDGALGSGTTINVTLSLGTHTLHLCADDPTSSQLQGCAMVTVTVSNPTPPTATISSVTQGSTRCCPGGPFSAGSTITLYGIGSNGQNATYTWTDSFLTAALITNAFGSSLPSPEVGRHKITLTVVDDVGQQAIDSVTFVVLAANQTQLVQPFASVNTTLSNANVDALAADSMSQVLVSNPAPGLYRFDGTNIAASGTLDSTTLPGRVRAIAIQEASSLVYLATDNGLLVCAYTANSALGTCTTFAGNNIPDNHVTSVTRSTAYLALGTQKGVFLTTTVAGSNTGTSVLMNENIGGTVASSGLLWIASRSSGLSSYNPVTSALVNHSGGPSQVLQAIALDASGAVWVGSDTGFGRYAPSQQQWTTWSTSDASDPKLVSNNVQCLAVTRVTLSGQAARDVIWLGTDAGVSRFDPSVPSFMTLTMSDGLPSNNVHSIAVLPSGNKVFGTAAGVALYSGH